MSRQVPILTIDISSVVEHRVEAGPVSRVPDTDAAVPAAGHDEVRDLCVPHEPSDRSRVSLQHDRVPLLGVVPHAYRAEIRTGGTESRTTSCCFTVGGLTKEVRFYHLLYVYTSKPSALVKFECIFVPGFSTSKLGCIRGFVRNNRKETKSWWCLIYYYERVIMYVSRLNAWIILALFDKISERAMNKLVNWYLNRNLPRATSVFFSLCLTVMAYLHLGRRTQRWTRWQIPNPMAIFY